jgi:hypothetical protein
MATTAALTVEVEPEEAGLDPERLARLDSYLDGYVANGRHKGSLLVITRGGGSLTSPGAGIATRTPAWRWSPTRSGASTR